VVRQSGTAVRRTVTRARARIAQPSGAIVLKNNSWLGSLAPWLRAIDWNRLRVRYTPVASFARNCRQSHDGRGRTGGRTDPGRGRLSAEQFFTFRCLPAFSARLPHHSRERVSARIHKARANGKKQGRSKSAVDRERILELKAEGQSLRQIAANLGVGYGTVRARLLTSRKT
jgi:Homeodomain-like domain